MGIGSINVDLGKNNYILSKMMELLWRIFKKDIFKQFLWV